MSLTVKGRRVPSHSTIKLSQQTESFLKRLSGVQSRMESVLSDILPKADGEQAIVMEAMRYAALDGGKRLRPFLAIETARLLGSETEVIWRAAAGLECIHVYSLIHDDLPCMDDDDLRRGRPTVHKAYDEAIAVLAGDALQTTAFDIISHLNTSESIRLSLIQELTRASGVYGMVGGQVIDIMAAEHDRNETLINRLQALKTGALIRCAVRFGALISESDTADRDNLTAYADDLGLLFQITDDILDIEGDAARMGKAARKDENLGKATFVSILGLEGAKDKARALAGRAKGRLEPYGEKGHILASTVDYVLTRDT